MVLVKMVNKFSIGFYIFIWLETIHSIKSHASERFVVSANFGVQPNRQLLKNPQAPNNQGFRPTRFYSIYCATTQSPKRRVSVAEANNKNNSQLAQASETNSIISEEFEKPSIKELQQVINKIVKSPSTIHRVVKAPAVYEIHLQEDTNVEPWRFNSLRKPPTKFWNMPRNMYYSRPSRTYSNQKPLNSSSKLIVNGRNKIRYPDTDLRWYYAKKNEPPNSLRRKSAASRYQSHIIRRNGESFFPFLNGLNYVFHVREKTGAGDK